MITIFNYNYFFFNTLYLLTNAKQLLIKYESKYYNLTL